MNISVQKFILAKEFNGQAFALMKKEGLDTTTLVVQPLSEAFLLGSGKHTQFELLSFDNAEMASKKLAELEQALAQGIRSVGCHYLDNDRTSYEGLVAATIDIEARISLSGQQKLDF